MDTAKCFAKNGNGKGQILPTGKATGGGKGADHRGKVGKAEPEFCAHKERNHKGLGGPVGRNMEVSKKKKN